jgi:chromosome segregation ATPase
MHKQILSALDITDSSNNSNANDDQIQEAISALLNNTKVLIHNIQRMNRECDSYQYSIADVSQQWSLLEGFAQEINGRISGVEINRNLLRRQLLLLKERVEDAQVKSFDGTLTWKITDFDEKRSTLNKLNFSIFLLTFIE